MYDYKIRKFHRVVDGDTYDIEIDLGFYQFGVYRVRLLHWDTPEVYGRYATEQGPEAKGFVEQWVLTHSDHVKVATTQKADSFGRWLASIFCLECEEDLGTNLFDAGLATPYEE